MEVVPYEFYSTKTFLVNSPPTTLLCAYWSFMNCYVTKDSAAMNFIEMMRELTLDDTTD